MKNRVSLGLVVVAAMAAAGCASGPTITESQGDLPEIKQGMSRIFVYRTGVMGAAVQPVVFVDGRETGKCKPKGIFYVDVPAGQHTVSAKTEVEKSTGVDTSGQPVAYVKCGITMGLFVGRPALDNVTVGQGQADSADLAFTGAF